ncbi:hypothetical protein CALCODRAFT_495747 [Calocera cornea HHB12733]|uniref:SWIM-type domain-containing protein n=1 Tax=Calocera cornea HHB12733 TaxID=1353952 RepID=A0A165G854_9BASI|nr:hypothetical protein CALCODRAFT_495747 [Calocera cornea HHB12733]
MPHLEMIKMGESLLDSIEPGGLSEQQIHSLHLVFQNTLVAALDALDKGRVIKLVTPYGRHFYRVYGGKEAKDKYKYVYTVHPQLMSTFPPSCTCPSFAYSVLLSDTHLMCKHVLAVRLGERLNKCIIQPASDDDIAELCFPPPPDPSSKAT